MRIGITILPQTRWREQAQLWRRAEEYGFDHAWTYDHLTWDPLADEPWGATVPTLVAAATVTSRIGLGPWVSSPNYRHPVPFARELGALDDVSDGRSIVVVGAGTHQADGEVLGAGAAGGAHLSPGGRAGRLEEFVGLLDLMQRQASTSFEGRYYQAVEARTILPDPPRTRPPLIVAANGPRLIRLAARHDGWATLGIRSEDPEEWWESVRRLMATFEAAVADAGTSPSWRMLSVDVATGFALTSAGHFADTVGRAAELGFTDVVTHWPRPAGPYAGSEAVLEQVAAILPSLR